MSYSEAKIYRLFNNVDSSFYVGSTTQSLCQRLSGHKVASIKGTSKLYDHMKLRGCHRFFIRLIKAVDCDNREELNRIEGEYIIELKPDLNSNIAGRTDKEYRSDHQDKIKEYYIKNADKLKKYQDTYYSNNVNKIKKYYSDNVDKLREKSACLCGGKYTHANRSIHEKSIKHQKFINSQQ